jgi:transcriptional regulator with XRE-family HTH domain
VEKSTQHIGRRLRFLVERSGKSISEVSEVSGIERSYLQKLFNKEEVGMKMLQRLAPVLGFSVAEILQEKNPYSKTKGKTQTVEEGEVTYKEKYIERLEETIEILNDQIQELKEDKKRLSTIIDKHFNVQSKVT